MRKKRSDRNHVIYEIVNTSNGKSYIGITAAVGRRYNYSAVLRFQKHQSRARKENKEWALYIDMRENDPSVYELFIVDVVRGKALAHQIETKLLKKFEYELNSTH
jgi:predicted GIY-YIG superfamily endonuclease